jgi:hypothetical protein
MLAQRLIGVLRSLADDIEQRRVPMWIVRRLITALHHENAIADRIRERRAQEAA